MQSHTDSNRRIARNTLLLYFRMILTMCITLYTSRVILAALGVEDFGIYNIVAGVVVLFSFLNSAMTNATQRYLSMALGLGKAKYVQLIFSTSLLSHLVISGVLLVLCETVGLWFVNTQLIIPADRMMAANVAYQFAILITVIDINRIPFFSSIIAHERMTFFAYLAIVESLLKLAVALSISYACSVDKLILYAGLLAVSSAVIFTTFFVYCLRHFDTNRPVLKFKKKLFCEFVTFTGWNLLGSASYLGYSQGINIVLNFFKGVTLNATMGITYQIRHAVFSMVYYLQMATNPQIIKSYTVNERERFESLVNNISKFSFFLMLLIAIPIVLNMDFVLNLWLKNPPVYSAPFCAMIIIICLFDALEGPLWQAVQASGRVRNYQIVTSIILILNIPASYVALYYGMLPVSVLVIQLVLTVAALATRLYFACRYTSITAGGYIRKVVLPIAAVTLVSVPACYFATIALTQWSKLVVATLLSITVVSAASYFFGLDASGRQMVKSFVKSKLHKAA